MKKTTIMTCLMILLGSLILSGLALADDKTNYVVTCVGDGMTEGKWPGKLQSMLNGYSGANFQVINKGAWGKSPFDFAHLDTNWLSTNPDIVCILLGSTDFYFFWIEHNLNDGRTIETAQWVQEVVNRAWEYRSNPPIIILSLIPPMTAGDPTYFVRVFNDYIKANAYHVDALITGNFDDFWNPDAQCARAEYFASEMDLNDSGQQILANNFYSAITSVLGVATRDPSGSKDSLYY